MKKYSKETLLKAMERVWEGSMSIRRASKEYGVPYGTLGDKLRGRRPIQAKPKFVLSEEDEAKLVEWIKELGRRGFGCTRDEIKDAVKRILDSRGVIDTKLKDNRPGKFWMANFFKRHPELSLRTPQALGKERALVTREGLERWFHEFKTYVHGEDSEILVSRTGFGMPMNRDSASPRRPRKSSWRGGKNTPISLQAVQNPK